MPAFPMLRSNGLLPTVEMHAFAIPISTQQGLLEGLSRCMISQTPPPEASVTVEPKIWVVADFETVVGSLKLGQSAAKLLMAMINRHVNVRR